MKKVIALALTTTLLLTGCGKEEAKPTSTDQTTEQLLARISELEKENKKLKEELNQNPEPQEAVSDEQTEETQEPVVEENPEQTEEQTPASKEQTIQSQPGNTQEANYFELMGKNGVYKQTGDAFIVDSEYGEEKILVIPIQFTNLSEEASDPWISFAFEYQAFQEDDVQEYTLNGGQGAVPEEYENPLNLNIKQAKSVDYYLTFTLEKDGLDIKFKDPWSDDIKAILKFQ